MGSSGSYWKVVGSLGAILGAGLHALTLLILFYKKIKDEFASLSGKVE